MVNDALSMLLGADDLSLQRGDPRIKLLDRKRVEFLSGQRVHRITRPTREILFGLHNCKR